MTMTTNETGELVGLETVAARDTTTTEEAAEPLARPPTFAVGEHVHIDGVEFKITYVRDDGRMTLERVRP
jgi:hypothetical protein